MAVQVTCHLLYADGVQAPQFKNSVERSFGCDPGMIVDKTCAHWNLITADESGLDVEPGSIGGINTEECSESLAAGGNQPAHSEACYDEVRSEYAPRNSRVRDELRVALSRACCQVP